MNRKELGKRYWKYYLLLERRFLQSIEYVELYEDNYSAFSNGYALLIQAIGAELDTVFKIYCGYNLTDRKTITDYANCIMNSSNGTINIREIKINILEYDLEIHPFKDWQIECAAKSLIWWDSFDKLKHNRYDQLKLATQENTINILSALYLIEMLLLKKITENTEKFDVFDESSKLFSLKNWSAKAIPMSQVFAVLSDMIETGKTDRVFDV